jgi:hypothetical protein
MIQAMLLLIIRAITSGQVAALNLSQFVVGQKRDKELRISLSVPQLIS